MFKYPSNTPGLPLCRRGVVVSSRNCLMDSFLTEQLPHCLYWYFGIDTPLSSVRGSLLPKLCYFRYDVSGVLFLCKKSPRTS